jgi:large conductance mechanosensitive channel
MLIESGRIHRAEQAPPLQMAASSAAGERCQDSECGVGRGVGGGRLRVDFLNYWEEPMRGFKQFLLRGNVVDLAVGVVIGAAFAGLVGAIVKDLLTPLISAIGKLPDFSELFFTINGSKFMYGDFINATLGFTIAALSVYFLVVMPMNHLLAKMKKEPDPTTRNCAECLSEIPLQAKRCKFCTAVIA